MFIVPMFFMALASMSSLVLTLIARVQAIVGGGLDATTMFTDVLQSVIIVPMLVLIVIGVLGMAVASFIIAKVLKMSFPLAFANGLTALYGFPCDAIITESTFKSLAQTDDEFNFLMSKMFPSMIVGGFVTVTITSVFIAGAFASFFA